MDPSYCTRLESGEREPPRRHIVEALGQGLRLNALDRDRLLVAAGYTPRKLDWSPSIAAAVEVLGDYTIEPERRAKFGELVYELAKGWK